MKKYPPETVLNSILILLLGFCIGIIATENKAPISDIANISIATIAFLGYFGWRRGIDYQERKNDRKILIRKIKNLELSTDEILKKAGFPLTLIQEAKNKNSDLNDFERILIKKDLGEIEKATGTMRSIQAEIESESSASRLVQESATLATNIANLIIKNSQIANLADSIAFSQQAIKLDATIESFADHTDTLERLTQLYNSYYASNALIEIELGAFETTKKKQETYREHYNRTNKTS